MLIGGSSSGKSTFAKKHFKATEVISSDACRAEICGSENNMHYLSAGFELLESKLQVRLIKKQTAVIDATNLREQDREVYLDLAQAHKVEVMVIILNTPLDLCLKRYAKRTDRPVGLEHVVRRHYLQLEKAISQIESDGRYYRVRILEPQDLKLLKIKYN